jgi:hypothetical protein
MRTAIARSITPSVLGTALALVVASACGYSPNPESGTLKCGSSNSCPEGYSCSSGRCWKDGAGGTGGSSSGHGGSGGSGGSSGADKFIGTWRFISPSSRMIACTDGSSENKDWSNLGESFDVSVGPVSALTTYYYCDWDLDVASGGTSTVIKPGAACTGDDGATPPTTYTWHGMLFTLSTSNGQSGTLIADLPFDYSSTAGSGSCTMHFTGTLTKN